MLTLTPLSHALVSELLILSERFSSSPYNWVVFLPTEVFNCLHRVEKVGRHWREKLPSDSRLSKDRPKAGAVWDSCHPQKNALINLSNNKGLAQDFPSCSLGACRHIFRGEILVASISK